MRYGNLDDTPNNGRLYLRVLYLSKRVYYKDERIYGENLKTLRGLLASYQETINEWLKIVYVCENYEILIAYNGIEKRKIKEERR